MAAGRWVGRGDKIGGDRAAADAMRQLITTVGVKGLVDVGGGEEAEVPLVSTGGQARSGEGGEGAEVVGPTDGHALTATGLRNEFGRRAGAEGGAIWDPSAEFHVEKLVAGYA